jgi:hypothetical protein
MRSEIAMAARERDRDRELLIIPVTSEPVDISAGGGDDSEPTTPVMIGSPSARGHHHPPTGIEVPIILNIHTIEQYPPKIVHSRALCQNKLWKVQLPNAVPDLGLIFRQCVWTSAVTNR